MASLLSTGLIQSHHLSSRTHRVKLLSCSTDSPTPPITRKLIKESKLSRDSSRKIKVVDYCPLIESLKRRRLPDEAHEIFIQMKSDNLLPNYRTLSALMLCFAQNACLFLSSATSLLTCKKRSEPALA
ncbi:hypothetical protein DY000_02008356 [Brassica cretica]|uniref:Pentatricopeptide repeat-containing protein n=1 Tax=Brassica cretica TaxID=69181 RepID=A0ABQ7CFT2_BRACR|nr:hypothetical protein DY000_02008356 [Brassica cretica]